MSIVLRPHHLLCTQGYSGHGYSEAFVEHMNDDYAAFAGCSAETEASFKTVTFLSGKIDEIGTGSILVIDGSDKRIANTIKGNTNQKIPSE